MKLKLPKSLLALPDTDRDDIITVLLEASKLPKTKQLPFRQGGDEHNMWERNVDDLLADVEDDFYREMVEAEARVMGDLMHAFDLPTDGIEKALEPEYLAFEDELIKAKDSGRSRMSDLIKKMTKERKEKFSKWLQDGKALTKHQLNAIDSLLSRRLPDYAKRAESYIVRAGFVGKIRSQAEQENFDTLGAYIDRFPESIEAARKEGVVLTHRHRAKEETKGNKVKVLPLTPQEAEAITHASHHAGDKIQEISEKHRAGVRQLVIQAKRERWSAQQLSQKLFDKFGEHNRDWRRVAITELAFATNDAYLSGIEEGETVVGMGAENACRHCKQYVIGKTFEVTHKPPSEDTYEGDMKQVWVGKSNYGRRVAEFRPAIPMHPNCRCRWHRISRFYKLGNNGKLELKSTEELINEERAKRGLAPDESLKNETSEERLKRLSEKFIANNQ